LPCPQPLCGPFDLQDDVAVVHAYDHELRSPNALDLPS
jgi:hypothetical protein